MADKLKIRRDSSSNWINVNPILDSGEFGFETNTRRLKVGDGSTQWTSLLYASITSADLENALLAKANVATTLAGYGITDAYTITEITNLLLNKADKNNVFTKTETNTLLAAKINITDVLNVLNSTDTTKPLAAAQGKVLKDLIDNLIVLLTSDDTALDSLQEIVSYIKANKEDLQNLSVDNIAGLQDLLMQSAVVITPTITSPANAAVDFNGSITSTYTTSESYEGLQSKVIWECALDEDFTNIIDSYEGSDNLTSWTPNIGLPLTQVYIRTKQISDGHRSTFSDTVSFTTPNIFVQTPTITVDGAPSDVKKNPKITLSAFSVFNGTDTQELSDYQVIKVSDGTVVWESLDNTTDLLSITTGDLEVSEQYKFRARQKGTVYGYSSWIETTVTTASVFTPTIGTQGSWGFGTAPTDGPFALLGLAEMTGTNEYGHANYGNYIHTNGSIVCWRPKAYARFGNASSPRYATYGENAIDIVGTDVFESEAEANAAGYILPRCFINNGVEQPGFFQDKYMNSKDGTASSKSVFGGVPISLATTAGYTVSNGMTGCTGILADAVVLSKSRGARWNCSAAFMYAWAFIVSVAHGQAATDTANCAWYDPTGTTNFPKGCNNNALSDVNDSSVVYATAGDSGNANKPKTGATANFNKTTDNGCANGIADLNGGMFEVTIGITNIGTSATSTTAITTDTIYILKPSVDIASLTGGWDGTNDVWGNTTNLSTKYDAVTSPHPLGSATGTVYWGNNTNAVFPTATSGVSRDIAGFIPKDSTAANATGINMLGNDYFYKYNTQNLTPVSCGYWYGASGAGLGYRDFGYYRSYGHDYVSFRASAYFA